MSKNFSHHEYLDDDFSKINNFKDLLINEITEYIEEIYLTEKVTHFPIKSLNNKIKKLIITTNKLGGDIIIIPVSDLDTSVPMLETPKETIKSVLNFYLKVISAYHNVKQITFKLTSYFKLKDKILVFY